ncbi:MAG: BREX-1 system phosphatase PglZ type A, partial [Candidatus Auribacterota bacterium]|nr:BREX-1 system phosphatase PglZ type A [Candidatus Auribacterota bacterium]
MSKIATALQEIFSEHRLVFWYDDKEELRQEYEEIDLPGVIKIEVRNDEFGVKFRVTRTESDRQFLLYFPSPRPPDIENWLLDLVLANYEFRTDQSAIFLQELGLEYEFKPVVTEHLVFFKSKERINALKDLLDPDDQESRIRLKMLAVICKCEADLEHILMVLLDDLAASEDGGLNRIVRYSLDGFLWDQAGKLFG